MQFDLIVIGAGSGGVRAARLAANSGMKVLAVESDRYGGTCVNVGCIPKKLFVIASKFASETQVAKHYGWDSKISFNWGAFKHNRDNEIKRLNGVYKGILENNQVERLDGEAKFIDANTIRVTHKDGSSQQVTGRKIIIATGSKPKSLDIPGAKLCINSNDFFELEVQPESVALLGSGYIAVEIACVLALLGVQTKMIYRAEHVLRGFDEGIRLALEHEMDQCGVIRVPSNTPVEIRTSNGGVEVITDKQTIQAQYCMMATGRVAKTAALDLGQAGVAARHDGSLKVNSSFQTNIRNIYAIGDVIGGIQLTPVAIAQAKTLIANLSKGQLDSIDFENIPSSIFSSPEIGIVWLTEADAAKKCKESWVYETKFKSLKYTLSDKTSKTYIKIITETKHGRIIGVHLMGEAAGELIQVIGVWLQTQTTMKHLRATIPVHPTWAEEIVTLGEGRAAKP